MSGLAAVFRAIARFALFHRHRDFSRRSKLEDIPRWYVSRFVESVARQLAPGTVLLDAGAGECTYKPLFAHCTYTAVDLGVGDATWDYRGLDYVGRLDNLPFRDASHDAILCTQVLEHLEKPAEVIREFHRLLKPGGRLFLTAPMAHFEHQVPHDFFRYTSYGLGLLLDGAGFRERHIEPFGGMLTRWAGELPRMMRLFPGTGVTTGSWSLKGIAFLPLRIGCAIVIRALQLVLISADRFDRERIDPLGWSAVAVK